LIQFPNSKPDKTFLKIGARALQFQRKYFPLATTADWNSWEWQLRNSITSWQALQKVLQLSDDEVRAMADESGNLPLRLTPYYASLLDAADPLQPLRRSVVPVTAEQLNSCGEAADPLGEDTHSRVPGLVHRYPDRVLFLVTGFCSTYCRYCTRSRLVGDQNKRHLNREQWDRALSYIEMNPDIRDVLLSGGDPLTLPDNSLEYLLTRLSRIPHVEFVRIGSKVPVVLPQRVTHALVNLLKRFRPLWLSLHFTHPDEITPETAQACERLADAGIPLGSQTVLLKGINDSVPVMKKLMHELLKIRVRPYYLYQCDPRPHQRLRGAALRRRRPGRRRQDPAASRLLPGTRGRRRAPAQLSEEHLPLPGQRGRRGGSGRGRGRLNPFFAVTACISAAVVIKSDH
jgi:lysine 2,3-aminomutase